MCTRSFGVWRRCTVTVLPSFVVATRRQVRVAGAGDLILQLGVPPAVIQGDADAEIGCRGRMRLDPLAQVIEAWARVREAAPGASDLERVARLEMARTRLELAQRGQRAGVSGHAQALDERLKEDLEPLARPALAGPILRWRE